MPISPLFQALSLLAVANGTPVIIKKVAGARMAFPLDGRFKFFDGKPLLGSSKTFRGVLSSIAVTTALAPLFGATIEVGALVASFAMLGDLFSSFTKRRLGFPPSTQAIGLDQIPESLFPLLASQKQLSLSLTQVAICVGMFLVAELIVSRILYKLRVRDQPY